MTALENLFGASSRGRIRINLDYAEDALTEEQSICGTEGMLPTFDWCDVANMPVDVTHGSHWSVSIQWYCVWQVTPILLALVAHAAAICLCLTVVQAWQGAVWCCEEQVDQQLLGSARRQAEASVTLPIEARRRRLVGWLQRRGHDWDTISRVLALLQLK